ncbi:MAG: LexA family transcriptional regulator [Ruminiclostridium sp.]|nr:LexA family transcriptional regulator [Ruminiclostridium sp.]
MFVSNKESGDNMSNLYNKIEKLCNQQNITITQLCKELNISRSSLSELNAGRTKQLSVTVMRKISDYFNVSVDWFTSDSIKLDFAPREFDDAQLWCPICGSETIEFISTLALDPDNDKSFGIALKFQCEEEHNFYYVIESYKGNSYIVMTDDESVIYNQNEILYKRSPQSLMDITDDTFIDTNINKKYHTLDRYGKKAVDDILNIEYERCTAPSETAPIPTIKIKHSEYKASAGFGFDLEDRDEWDEIDIPDTPEARDADFAVTIFGNSMEPIYHDSDIVLVKIQDRVNIGETGIFVVNGQGYIKQYGGDRLISVNSDYKDIVFTEGDFIKCAGKVIGIAG